MWDICHPAYYNMSQLGCNDQEKLQLAFYVYMELCEVKCYWDVHYNYCKELEIFYLEAKRKKNEEPGIFIPWPACSYLSLDLISNIQRELKTDKITFAFKAGMVESSYYSINSGLVKPMDLEQSKILNDKKIQKHKQVKEIERNTSNLYKRALSLQNDQCDSETAYDNRFNHEGGSYKRIRLDNLNESEVIEINIDGSTENVEPKTNESTNNISR
ncbi:tRNA-splicing endonuclease subunit Sen15-like [Trichogramma pretiosum]|uniref:tRNA-splicing endonuclease subunit Sen15-like n=1 Tax=Trichogramma pretiosum TaxID=7493 RepID=UPI0006C9DBB1|nr:tRNA-splicing endonuclease subunit Sen15-like [Trichogramma pretiosum]